jgi:hypothetical protein
MLNEISIFENSLSSQNLSSTAVINYLGRFFSDNYENINKEE